MQSKIDELFSVYWEFQQWEETYEERLKLAKAKKQQVLDAISELVPLESLPAGKKSFTHPTGQFRYTKFEWVNVKDMDTFMMFVKEKERFDMLAKQCLKKPVIDYIKAEFDIPSGLEYGHMQKTSIQSLRETGDL